VYVTSSFNDLTIALEFFCRWLLSHAPSHCQTSELYLDLSETGREGPKHRWEDNIKMYLKEIGH
jgi:hypothetical protein